MILTFAWVNKWQNLLFPPNRSDEGFQSSRLEFVAKRKIYKFRRVPGSGFWKGVEIKMSLTLVFCEKMQKFLYASSPSPEGFRSSRLVQFVANREIYNFRRVPRSGFWKGGPNWDQTGTKLGPNWDQTGTKLGPNWNQIGTKLGTKLGPIWDYIGTKLGPN